MHVRCALQVPLSVSNVDFWRRYYYRYSLLEEDENRRMELMKRADVAQQEQKDIGWDEGRYQPHRMVGLLPMWSIKVLFGITNKSIAAAMNNSTVSDNGGRR